MSNYGIVLFPARREHTGEYNELDITPVPTVGSTVAN